MDLHDAIEIRWGGPSQTDARQDDYKAADRRNASLWRRVQEISGALEVAPRVWAVHTAHALPAIIAHDERPVIVWDAGVGSVFDLLSYPLPYAQSEEALQAIVLRLCAIRLAVGAQAGKARRYAARSKGLLTLHPFDRRYRLLGDAESQFEVWLTTELQEQFALGHEQIHYLRRVDEVSFGRLELMILDALSRATQEFPSDDSPLRTALDQSSSDMLLALARDRFLNVHAWYLGLWRDGSSRTVDLSEWTAKAERVKEALLSAPVLLAETVCDVSAALALCVDSHFRRQGWDATLSAACSRVALEHLGMILRIDVMMSIRSSSAATSKAGLDIRAECMEVVLPILLHDALGPDEEVPPVSDLREVMRLAGERASLLYSSALQLIESSATEPDDVAEIATRGDFLESSFLNLRADPDVRAGIRFHLGVIHLARGIESLIATRPGTGVEIEVLLARHERGDWGSIYEEDAEANLSAIGREFESLSTEDIRMHRGAIWSSYMVEGAQVLIKTNRERTLTTVMTTADL